MKLLIWFLLNFILSLQAIAFDIFSNVDGACQTVADMGEIIMTERQYEGSKKKLIRDLDLIKNTRPYTWMMGKKILKDAYEIPIYNSEALKKSAIQKYRKISHQYCYIVVDKMKKFNLK